MIKVYQSDQSVSKGSKCIKVYQSKLSVIKVYHEKKPKKNFQWSKCITKKNPKKTFSDQSVSRKKTQKKRLGIKVYQSVSDLAPGRGFLVKTGTLPKSALNQLTASDVTVLVNFLIFKRLVFHLHFAMWME